MAAEDYFDDPYDWATAEDHNARAFLRSPAKPKRKGKNKDVEWITGSGEVIRIADMEDSHLGNTIRYIARKLDEHSKATQLMATRGFVVPPYVINKRSGDEWLDVLGKEANRRKAKEISKAKQILHGTTPA